MTGWSIVFHGRQGRPTDEFLRLDKVWSRSWMHRFVHYFTCALNGSWIHGFVRYCTCALKNSIPMFVAAPATFMYFPEWLAWMTTTPPPLGMILNLLFAALGSLHWWIVAPGKMDPLWTNYYDSKENRVIDRVSVTWTYFAKNVGRGKARVMQRPICSRTVVAQGTSNIYAFPGFHVCNVKGVIKKISALDVPPSCSPK